MTPATPPPGFHEKLRVKYFLDILSAWVCLFLFWPFLLFFAILIKLDGLLHPENAGPVFYKEARMSAGKIFMMYKFRTITVKEIKESLEKNPGVRSITSGVSQTWAGKIILSHYCDEFPQLINIARGEMSFVGPRPHIVNQAKEEAAKGLTYRQFMKAGLFGVPQACKRHPQYEALFRRMAETHRSEALIDRLDALYYLELKKRSPIGIFFFDLWVVFKCMLVIMRGTGYSGT